LAGTEGDEPSPSIAAAIGAEPTDFSGRFASAFAAGDCAASGASVWSLGSAFFAPPASHADPDAPAAEAAHTPPPRWAVPLAAGVVALLMAPTALRTLRRPRVEMLPAGLAMQALPHA